MLPLCLLCQVHLCQIWIVVLFTFWQKKLKIPSSSKRLFLSHYALSNREVFVSHICGRKYQTNLSAKIFNLSVMKKLKAFYINFMQDIQLLFSFNRHQIKTDLVTLYMWFFIEEYSNEEIRLKYSGQKSVNL